MKYKPVKRLFDIVGAATIGAIALPLLIMPISLALLIQNKGDVFFTQPRIGKDGQEFNILKFKTMTDDCDEHGKLLPEEDRVTPFGRFLRKYSLDELPQLWNVLSNDMSLVGPRPLVARDIVVTDEVAENVNWLDKYARGREKVKPGIAGYHNVKDKKSNCRWASQLSNDIFYVKNHDLLMDLDILFLTAKVCILGREDTTITMDHGKTLNGFVENLKLNNEYYQPNIKLSMMIDIKSPLILYHHDRYKITMMI